MSESAIYKRKTKSGVELPGVTLEELKAMKRAGQKLQPGELIQATGVRSFVSDEKWLPASDYPELADHFPSVVGRELIEKEVKRTRSVQLYAAGALLICLLAGFLFWWQPYRDATDARGNLGRVIGELESTRKGAADRVAELNVMLADAMKRQASLEGELAKEKQKTAAATDRLKRTEASARKAKDSGAEASADVAELRSMVIGLRERLSETEQLPKFWPGAEALHAPADSAQVRVVSMIPNRGFVYVVGATPYANGNILLLRQSGLFGSRVHVRVLNTYDHGNGEWGHALQSPDMDEASARKLTSLGYGETLEVSFVSAGR